MAYARIAEGGRVTVLQVADEKCSHGFDLLEAWERRNPPVHNEEAWARFIDLREKHKAKDKKGIYR